MMSFPLMADESFLVLAPASAAGTCVTIGPAVVATATEKTFYVVFSETAMSGTVVVEASHSLGHAGPWAKLADAVCLRGGSVIRLSLPGVDLAVRVRIDKLIVNGTASVYAVGSA